MDYYNVLGLKRTCSKYDILNGFRKIVHEFGMGKLDDKNTHRRLIAFEAYDVLMDPFWRNLYDQFGELSIKSGVCISNEQGIKQYSYHGDIFFTYKMVYGSTNPFTHVICMLSKMKATPNVVKLPKVKKVPINLTLKEVFFGALKKIAIPQSDGTQNIVNINITKGLPVNTEIVHYLTDGNILIFITNDLPHKYFVREEENLIITYTVTIKEMLSGIQYQIKTLDNKFLKVNITQIITPTYQKRIPGEGMPVYRNEEKRGDIILKFKIKMPLYLPIMNETYCKILLDEKTIGKENIFF